MPAPRDVRRCALQALYQFDAGVEPSEDVRASLDASPGPSEAHDRGYKLAVEAWTGREAADAAVATLTPDWPTHRQPVIDRCILRLAYHEMITELAPPKVVINEAVELAREFSTEKSPLFVNGVLDKIYKDRWPRSDDQVGQDDQVDQVDQDDQVDQVDQVDPANPAEAPKLEQEQEQAG